MTADLPKQNEEICDCHPETTARKSCRRTKYGAPLRRRRITSAGRQTPNKHERSRSSSIARVTTYLASFSSPPNVLPDTRTLSPTFGGGHYTCCKPVISTTPPLACSQTSTAPSCFAPPTPHLPSNLQPRPWFTQDNTNGELQPGLAQPQSVKDCAVELHQKAFLCNLCLHLGRTLQCWWGA